MTVPDVTAADAGRSGRRRKAEGVFDVCMQLLTHDINNAADVGDTVMVRACPVS